MRERDVIVDPGAPAGSLLYRLSYGMTGGYVRSIEDATFTSGKDKGMVSDARQNINDDCFIQVRQNQIKQVTFSGRCLDALG